VLMAKFGLTHIEQLSGKQIRNRSVGGLIMFVSLAVAIMGL